MKIRVYIMIVRRKWSLTDVRSWLSLIIRWRYNSWSNHAAFLIENDYGSFIIDSDFPGGLRIIPSENWRHKDCELRYKEELVDFEKLIEKVGIARYDFQSLLRHLGVWYNWKKKRGDSKRFTCYELIGWVLEKENWYKFRPNDVEKMFENLELS